MNNFSTTANDRPHDLQLLLSRTSMKDSTAFRTLYDATSVKLYSFALRMLFKRELAEEVLQDSFVKIWHSAHQYRADLATPMTWMIAIVRNNAIDMLRRLDNAIEIDGDDFDSALLQSWESDDATPIQALEMTDNARSLNTCLSRLDHTQRQALALAFFHDLSYSEVADHLSSPIGTVKTWIRRGLEKLRLCIIRKEQP